MKFDLDKTADLVRLFAVPREERHDTWREAFFAAIPDASMAVPAQQVVRGPDGYSYFCLTVPDPGPFETFCLNHVLDVCLENGFGIVVMAGAPEPEWVFAYGDLWAFKETGGFVAGGPAVVVEEPMKVLVGAPAESMLPAYARGVLRRVLQAEGAREPVVWLVHAPGFDPERSLAFRPAPPPWLVWYVRRDFGVTAADETWAGGLPL